MQTYCLHVSDVESPSAKNSFKFVISLSPLSSLKSVSNLFCRFHSGGAKYSVSVIYILFASENGNELKIYFFPSLSLDNNFCFALWLEDLSRLCAALLAYFSEI